MAAHRYLQLAVRCEHERFNIEAVAGKRRPRRLALVNYQTQDEAE